VEIARQIVDLDPIRESLAKLSKKAK